MKIAVGILSFWAAECGGCGVGACRVFGLFDVGVVVCGGCGMWGSKSKSLVQSGPCTWLLASNQERERDDTKQKMCAVLAL